MTTASPTTHHHTWTRDPYLISTDPSLISLAALNDAFASPEVYWARALPFPDLQTLVANSRCFGLYGAPPSTDEHTSHTNAHLISNPINLSASRHPPQRPLLGFARLIADHVSLAFLTDVYVLPSHQGQGLGDWLISCVKDVVEGMPHLRQLVLVASEGKGEAYYARALGTGRMEERGGGVRLVSWLGPGSGL